jgi:AGZA family xanthine/uracil permease-like MFS transporter
MLVLLLSVTFDTLGTFIGAVRVSGIFDTEEEKSLAKKGINSKFEKVLFSDDIVAAFRGLFGTNSVTTYV